MWSKKDKPAAEDVRERERGGQSVQDLLGHGQELKVDTNCDGKPWKCLSSRVTWTELHMWKIPFTLKIQVTSDARYAYVPRGHVLAPCPVPLMWNVPQDPSGTCKSWYTTITLWAALSALSLQNIHVEAGLRRQCLNCLGCIGTRALY